MCFKKLTKTAMNVDNDDGKKRPAKQLQTEFALLVAPTAMNQHAGTRRTVASCCSFYE